MTIENFFQELDGFFSENEIEEAGVFLEQALEEARRTEDLSLEISVLNEMMGYYRSTDRKEKGLQSVEDGLALIQKNGLEAHPGVANMWINMGTTLCHFERVEEAEVCYKNAEMFVMQSGAGALQMASLYNNTAAIYVKTGRYEEARQRYEKALEYLAQIDENSEFWEDIQFNRIVTWLNMIVMNCVKQQGAGEENQQLVEKIKEIMSSEDFQNTESFPYAVKKCIHCFENLQDQQNKEWFEQFTGV